MRGSLLRVRVTTSIVDLCMWPTRPWTPSCTARISAARVEGCVWTRWDGDGATHAECSGWHRLHRLATFTCGCSCPLVPVLSVSWALVLHRLFHTHAAYYLHIDTHVSSHANTCPTLHPAPRPCVAARSTRTTTRCSHLAASLGS